MRLGCVWVLRCCNRNLCQALRSSVTSLEMQLQVRSAPRLQIRGTLCKRACPQSERKTQIGKLTAGATSRRAAASRLGLAALRAALDPLGGLRAPRGDAAPSARAPAAAAGGNGLRRRAVRGEREGCSPAASPCRKLWEALRVTPSLTRESGSCTRSTAPAERSPRQHLPGPRRCGAPRGAAPGEGAGLEPPARRAQRMTASYPAAAGPPPPPPAALGLPRVPQPDPGALAPPAPRPAPLLAALPVPCGSSRPLRRSSPHEVHSPRPAQRCAPPPAGPAAPPHAPSRGVRLPTCARSAPPRPARRPGAYCPQRCAAGAGPFAPRAARLVRCLASIPCNFKSPRSFIPAIPANSGLAEEICSPLTCTLLWLNEVFCCTGYRRKCISERVEGYHPIKAVSLGVIMAFGFQ